MSFLRFNSFTRKTETKYFEETRGNLTLRDLLGDLHKFENLFKNYISTCVENYKCYIGGYLWIANNRLGLIGYEEDNSFIIIFNYTFPVSGKSKAEIINVNVDIYDGSHVLSELIPQT